MWLAASLALVEPCQWRRTSALLPQTSVDLQICIDDLKFSEAEVRMLAMPKGATAALSSVIRRLPRWVVEEHAQVCEMVRIQMLLLFAEWRELSSCGVLVPGALALLRFNSSTPLSILVPPDREPRLQEAASNAERRSNGARQQLRECLLFFCTQVIWAT